VWGNLLFKIPKGHANCDCHGNQPIISSSKNNVATFLLRLLHQLSDIETLSGFFTARLFQAWKRACKVNPLSCLRECLRFFWWKPTFLTHHICVCKYFETPSSREWMRNPWYLRCTILNSAFQSRSWRWSSARMFYALLAFSSAERRLSACDLLAIFFKVASF